MKDAKEKQGTGSRVITVIGTVLCVIFAVILIGNCTLIVKSFTNPERVPSIGGTMPLIVLTDSMYPYIESGDLIICSEREAGSVKEGDVISFFDPDGNGTSIVTHRVVGIETEEGKLSFRTKGDANNTEDKTAVPEESLVGVYRMRIAGAGSAALFMQTTPGLIVCIAVPIVLLVGYDMLRRRKYERARQEDTAALLAELEELRAAQRTSDRQ